MWDRKTPTDNADEETKDNFYCSLPAVLDNIPKHDVTWLMVDFSARVGQEKSDGSTGSRRYHIQHRHQRLRGKWRHIVIGGTLFAHKDLSSIRWEHYKPDRPHHEQQQMKAISTGLQAVRHAHSGSGHNLVIAKIRLKLRRARIRTNKCKSWGPRSRRTILHHAQKPIQQTPRRHQSQTLLSLPAIKVLSCIILQPITEAM